MQFLVSRPSALLADEMGLGKTVQAAVAIDTRRETYRRVLIVSPASLCLNWLREIEVWAPAIPVRRVSATRTTGLNAVGVLKWNHLSGAPCFWLVSCSKTIIPEAREHLFAASGH